MTVRKICEYIDYVLPYIDDSGLKGKFSDYIVTVQNNTGNIVLLKELVVKAQEDIEDIEDSRVYELMTMLLKGKSETFFNNSHLEKLKDIKTGEYNEPTSLANYLTQTLKNLNNALKTNVNELIEIYNTIYIFIEHDLSEYQESDNSIFSIILNNKASYTTLDDLQKEFKQWNTALKIYKQLISAETPKDYEIIEIQQGSLDIIINLDFDIASCLIDLFNTGIAVFGAYISYKTLNQDINTQFRSEELLELEKKKDELLLAEIRIAIAQEVEKQLHEKVKKSKAGDKSKKMDIVIDTIYSHIIKGNDLKFISGPEEKEEIIEEKEATREETFIDAQRKFKLLSDDEKQKLLETIKTTDS